MASVHSVEEMGSILSLYQSGIATDWLWLGGSNSPEGGWAWSDRSACDFEDWYTGAMVFGVCLSYENYFWHWYKDDCAQCVTNI